MQRIGAYLLERFDDMQWPEARSAETQRLRSIVTTWLSSKGARTDANQGPYRPDDGSAGTFKIDSASYNEQETWSVELREETREGRIFSAIVWLTAEANRVSVYITLEAGWNSSRISPFFAEPRCPRIVRELLGQTQGWYHGASALRQGQSIFGFDQGEALAVEIEQSDRTVPVIVISTERGAQLLPDLDKQIAHELAGLANVVQVDEEASWAVTDMLGARFGCFSGAVRIYWPRFKDRHEPAIHPLWTADRLRSLGQEVTRTSERLRGQIRRLVFRASALSVLKPPAIDQIREGEQRRSFGSLRDRIKSLEDLEEFLPLYEQQNAELLKEKSQLLEKVATQGSQIAQLEAECDALRTNLRAIQSWKGDAEPADIAPASDDVSSDRNGPRPGEVRFYKKRYSKTTHDVMVTVDDCAHNNWRGASAADKAKKGIARFEGRDDWDLLQHCASCTGGGMWRVRW